MATAIGIKEKIEKLYTRVAGAAVKAGRPASDIILVAITKNAAVEDILQVRDAGIAIFGENRVQEAELKIPQVSAQWHMVGHLQTNKVKAAVSLFSMIQSVDSVRVAQAINDEALAQNKIMPVLLEVNITGQPQRFGYSTEEIYSAIDEMAELPQIQIQGLMGIAPNTKDEAERRNAFKKLKGVYSVCKALKKERLNLQFLSMGMSDDFEIAIEEGSNMIRVGRAIFK